MTITDVRSLIKGSVKKQAVSPELYHIYTIWEKKMKEQGEEISNVDAFFAGYVLANPIVREELKLTEPKEPSFNNKIQNILWK